LPVRESLAVKKSRLEARYLINCWAPKWSPDGRFIAAETVDSAGLVLYDVERERWQPRISVNKVIGYPCWSHDGKYLYFNTLPPDAAVYRLRVAGGGMDLVLSLKDVLMTGSVGQWFGLTPDDSPLILRATNIQEIYALDVAFP
jgi:hypothetical protein